MASDETPADVIKRASDVMYEHTNGGLYDPMGLARALADSGLLISEDQQEWRSTLWANAESVVKDANRAMLEAEHRAEQAEAEVARLSMAKVNQRDAETEAANAVSDLATAEAERDELRATVDRVTTLRDHWAVLAGLAMGADTREWLDAASKSLRAALDGAGEQ